MKKLFLFFNLLLIASCQIPYDGETKLIVVTKLIDADGKPIANEFIKATVYDENSIYSDIVSKGFSDNLGNLILIFAAPIGDQFKFRVSFANSESKYIEKKISNIFRKDFQQYKIVLNPIRLLKKEDLISFRILGNKVSTNKYVKDISINAVQPETDVYYNPIIILTDLITLNSNLRILKNQNFKLKYTIVDPTINDTGIESSINLVAGQTNFDYTIIY